MLATPVQLAVHKPNAAAIRAQLHVDFSVRDSIVVHTGGGFVMDYFVMVKPTGTRS